MCSGDEGQRGPIGVDGPIGLTGLPGPVRRCHDIDKPAPNNFHNSIMY